MTVHSYIFKIDFITAKADNAKKLISCKKTRKKIESFCKSLKKGHTSFNVYAAKKH